MSLREKVLSALLWTGGTRLAAQVVTWAITIVVIRLLSPEDYGLLAMAMVFVSFLMLLSEAGLGAAVVQRGDVDEGELRAVFGAAIVVDCALFAVLILAAPAIARFFEEDRLAPIIWALALQFLWATFAVIPSAVLARALDFRRLSMIGLIGAVCGSLSTLGLALSGYGVWSLVAGSLLASLIKVAALNAVSPFFKWPDFSLARARGLLLFGGQVTLARVLWYFYSQVDMLIAGKLLGKEALGFYSVSMHLASLPVQRISSLIAEVAFPAFARSQHDARLVSRYVLTSLRVLSFVSFPALWGISAIAPEIVAVLLGPKWQSAVLPLQLLPLIMPFSLLTPFLNTAFQGLGHSSVVLRNVLTASLIMPAAFLIGANWGLLGLCLAWVLGFPVVMAINVSRMLPLLALARRQLFWAVAPAALAGAGMYAAVNMARQLVPDTAGAASAMAFLIGIGVATYAALTWLLNRQGAGEIAQLLDLRRKAATP